MSTLPHRPATILYLDHAPIFGGAEVVMMNLIGALDRHQWAPGVATAPDSALMPALAAAGLPTYSVSFGRLNQAGLAMPFNLARAVLSVSRLLREHHFDLLITNTTRVHIVGALAASLTRTPLVWTIHDNTLPRRVARLLSRSPRAVITVSGWLRDFYDPAGLEQKITVVPNGLPPPKPMALGESVRAEYHMPSEAPLCLNVGRLVTGKAPHLFVRAAEIVAQAMPNAYFVMVGGPDPKEAGQRPSIYPQVLDQVVRDSGLGEKLILTGQRADTARFYAAADVVVYCSVLPEGWPTVLLEAMYHAKPVVATRLGGAPEIVKEGQTGCLVPPGQAEALAQSMLDLLQNPSRAQVLGLAGRTRLEQEFTLQTQIDRTTSVYTSVLSHQTGRSG